MQMWFTIKALVQPVESQEKTFINLPEVAGYQWQWWDPSNGGQEMAPDTSSATKGDNQLVDGWLRLIPDSQTD